MKLTELFKQNPNIIINTDIDGFLSGMILHTYCGCNVVGFSNSKSEVWVAPSINDIYKPIYIDLFVNRPDVYCIEQHIIAIDETHNQKLKHLGTKFNPNLERPGRTFVDDYYHKYPFATVHYIIAKLESEGVHVSLPNLNQVLTLNTPNGVFSAELGQILLRADDAMYSSLSAYKDNAISWWQWLLTLSNNADSIRSMIDYIGRQDESIAKDVKSQMGIFFKKGFGCDGVDGAFNTITDMSGMVEDRIKNYARILCQEFGLHINIPMFYNLHQGQFLKRFTNPKTVGEVQSMIEDPAMYSYAFIYGPYSKFQNFSYTLNME